MTATKATVAETVTTWEHGKLKLTLTRKSTNGGTPDTKVTVINKEGATRSPHSDGFMWSGSVDEFKAFSGSLSALYREVDQELFGARLADGCACPTQHTIDCPK